MTVEKVIIHLDIFLGLAILPNLLILPQYIDLFFNIPSSEILGQIFCSRGRPLENCRGRPVDFTGRPVNSTGRPLEFSRGRPVKFFIAFLDEIGNSKSFEANLQNSSGRPVGFLEDVQ